MCLYKGRTRCAILSCPRLTSSPFRSLESSQLIKWWNMQCYVTSTLVAPLNSSFNPHEDQNHETSNAPFNPNHETPNSPCNSYEDRNHRTNENRVPQEATDHFKSITQDQVFTCSSISLVPPRLRLPSLLWHKSDLYRAELSTLRKFPCNSFYF